MPKTNLNHAGFYIDPLTSVRAVSELLQDWPDLEDRNRCSFIDLILNSAGRMIHMVELLGLSYRSISDHSHQSYSFTSEA